jgi:hypothetical protein
MNRTSSTPIRREDQMLQDGPRDTNGAESIDKAIYVYVNEMEYKAILQWDEDGGSSVEIVYVVIPDDESEVDQGKVACSSSLIM